MRLTVLPSRTRCLWTRSCERGGLHPDCLLLVDANLGWHCF